MSPLFVTRARLFTSKGVFFVAFRCFSRRVRIIATNVPLTQKARHFSCSAKNDNGASQNRNGTLGTNWGIFSCSMANLTEMIGAIERP